MDPTKLLVCLAGLMVGGLYAGWQWRALAQQAKRQREQTQPPDLTAMLAGSLARIGILVVALVAAVVWLPKAQLRWLVIGIAAGYGVPFVWRLILTVSRRKSKPV